MQEAPQASHQSGSLTRQPQSEASPPADPTTGPCGQIFRRKEWQVDEEQREVFVGGDKGHCSLRVMEQVDSTSHEPGLDQYLARDNLNLESGLTCKKRNQRQRSVLSELQLTGTKNT